MWQVKCADTDLYLSWSEGLLSTEHYEEWQRDKGEEKVHEDAQVPRIPIAQKLKMWTRKKSIGMPFEVVPSRVHPTGDLEYKFHLPKGEWIEINDRQKQALAYLEIRKPSPTAGKDGILEFKKAKVEKTN